MRSLQRTTNLLAALAAVALLATPSLAELVSLAASNNSTVQPAGPRNGYEYYFNLEGSSNGSYASFGVIDFDFSSTSLSGTASDVTGATLSLTQANASFSTAGPVSVYLTDETSISPQSSLLKYISGQNGAACVDTDLLPITLVGSGTYTVGTSGDADDYSLTFTGGALTSILDAVNTGSTLRLVVTPDAASTAATYAGYSSYSYDGPTLTFDAVIVPEPASLLLLGLGAIALLVGRRSA